MVCSGGSDTACNRIAWQMPSGCPPVEAPVIDVLDLCSLPPLPDTSMREPPLVVPVPEIPGPEIVTCIHVDPKVSISISKTDERKSKSSFKQSDDDCATGLYDLEIEEVLPCPVEVDNTQSQFRDAGAAKGGLPVRGNVQLKGGECAVNGVDLELDVDCPINLPKSARGQSKSGLPAVVEFKANKGNGCEIGDLDLHIAVPCPINMSMPSMVHVSMYMIKLNKETPAKLPDASGLLKIHLAKDCKLVTLHRPIKRILGSVVDNFSVFTVCDTACGFSGVSLKLVVPPGCADTNFLATASAKYNAPPAVVKKLQPLKLAVNIGRSKIRRIEEDSVVPLKPYGIQSDTVGGKLTADNPSGCTFSVGVDLEIPPIFSCPLDNVRFSAHGPYKIVRNSVKKYSSDASCAVEFLFSGPNASCPLGSLSFTAPGRYAEMGFKLIKDYYKSDDGQCAARFRFTGPSMHNAVVKAGRNVTVTPKKVPYSPEAHKMSDPGGGVPGQDFTIDVDCMLDKLSIPSTNTVAVTRTNGPDCAAKFLLSVKSDNLEFHEIEGRGMARVYKTGDKPFKWIVSVPEMSVDGLSRDESIVQNVLVKDDGVYRRRDSVSFKNGLLKTWTDGTEEKFIDFTEWQGDTCVPLIVNSDVGAQTGHGNGGTKVTLKNCDGSADREFYVWNGNDGAPGKDGDTINVTTSDLAATSGHNQGGIKVTITYGGSTKSFDVWHGNNPSGGKSATITVCTDVAYSSSKIMKQKQTLTFTAGLLTNYSSASWSDVIGTTGCN